LPIQISKGKSGKEEYLTEIFQGLEKEEAVQFLIRYTCIKEKCSSQLLLVI